MSENPFPSLHSYWRMDYIQSHCAKNEKRNPFAQIHSTPEKDEENLVVARSEHSFIVMNRYPYNAGHLLVLPLAEKADLEDLSEEEYHDFFATVLLAKRILKAALKPEGFNVGMNLGPASGAGIPGHLHAHVVPRWFGDTNFMPVIANTRTLPASLESMWQQLRKHVS